MLQDHNVERYVSKRLEPIHEQIKELQAEMFRQMQAKNLHLQNVRQQSELLKAFCSMLLNAGDLTQQISDDEIDSFLKAFNCA